jgi:bifunctional NMN adenylyltransferase/nudix hydrolase
MKELAADVGVVIGRFQVDDLHAGHLNLLSTVEQSHNRLIIFVGLSHCKCTYNNPLDYESRRTMLQGHFPKATILYIKDVNDDSLWSKDLDDKIKTLIGPDQTACLYGSRDSFIPYYTGKYKVKELVQDTYYSGTEVRKQVAIRSNATRDFRAGAIWAMGNQYPSPQFTVDIAIFNDEFTHILLGRKVKETKFRLIGGFIQNSEKVSDAARREVLEETHLVLDKLTYIDSFPSTDWRYKGERDKITTILHTATIKSGTPQPDDDIHELHWFFFDEKIFDQVVPEHQEMMNFLLNRTRM